MDQEKDISLPPIAEEEKDTSTNFASDEMLVPDDAFAPENEEGASLADAELLPQSLSDEDDFSLDEDDGLFTDEEIASLLPAADEQFPTESAPVQSSDPENASASTDASAPENQAVVENKCACERTKAVDSFFDIAEMFVFALAVVLIAMSFFFRHSVVDGSSMENTLFEGEHLIISDFFYTPKQGDIVVVQDASKADAYPTLSNPIIKRVIATEGQTVSIRYNGEVYVDGVLLNEEYVKVDFSHYYDELSVTVPEGCLFLMGDHRNVSLDSREAGCFREEAILGKVILRFLPFDRFGTVK